MKKQLAGFIAVLLACALAPAQAAPPAFAGIFSDHAVLQRGEPLTVWGRATPGLPVKVSLAGATAGASAGADGRWRVNLPAMAAGGPHTLSVSGADGATSLKDIMIGDVYLCGGQSNMEFPVRLSTGALDQFPGNPNVEGDIWLADGTAVYHSTNSGATWTKLNGFATVGTNGAAGQLFGASTIALGKAQTGAPYSAAVYVVGTRNGVWGVYQSDDGGATWTRFNNDTHQYGGIGVMAGDWNTYGRIYFSGTGRGLIYTN